MAGPRLGPDGETRGVDVAPDSITNAGGPRLSHQADAARPPDDLGRQPAADTFRPPGASMASQKMAGSHRQPRRRLARRGRRVLLALIAGVIAIILVLVAALLLLIQTAPSVADAPKRVAAILTAHHARSDNGVIPARVATALLATEDSRYYHDPALDPLGVTRAAIGVVTSNGNDGGATIEQQLAKLLYVPGTGLGSELKQVGVAFRLDERFSKKSILAMYLDAAYFGDGAYGVTDAAQHYFGVPAGQLSWAQATLLAGLVQAPTAYDPHGHLSRARVRQSHVLSRLVATHAMTAAQAAQVYSDPLDPAVAFYG
jgi:membrane peptidoglycan carboxypeptidase